MDQSRQACRGKEGLLVDGCKIVAVVRMAGSGGGCSEALSSVLELLASQVWVLER